MPDRRLSAGADQPGTVTLDFQSPELGENTTSCFSPPVFGILRQSALVMQMLCKWFNKNS